MKSKQLVAKDSRPRRTRPRWRSIVAVGLIVAAAATRSSDFWAWQQSLVADRLAAVIGENTGSSGQLALERLTRFGDEAIEPLVRVAASRHAELAAKAQQALWDRLALWESELTDGDATVFAERIVTLATAIDRHMHELGPEAWIWAQRVSRTLVRHCDRLPAEDAMRTLLACEQIASIGQPTTNHLFSLNDMGSEEQSEPAALEPEPAPIASVMPEAVAKKPESLNVVPSPPVAAIPSEAPAQPREASSNGDARPLAELWMLPENPSDPPILETPLAGPITPVDVPSPDEVRRNMRRLRELSDRELLAQLSTASRFDAAAIRQVLISRGYGERILKLISQLSQAKPVERRRALERVSALPAAEARALLRWFVGDEDPDIRLQALSKLATTSDPRLPEILRDRAVEDADPRVSELATRIMRGELK